MYINKKKYDLNKQSKEISRDELVKDNQVFKNIFDQLDAADGKRNGKLNKKDLYNIFKTIVSIDKRNSGQIIDTFTDKEFEQLKQTLLPNSKISLNDFKSFVIRLLNLNEYHYINTSLGKVQNGCRIVNPNNIAIRESRRVNSPLANQSTIVNEKIDGFSQGKRGDCYLLAEINAIKNTQNGAKVFQKNMERRNDGSVVITLPGALKIKQNLAANYPHKKNLIEITGKYYIPKSTIVKACQLAGDTYSKGDADVILYEIAFEAYRMELAKTNKNLNIPLDDPDRVSAEGNEANNNTDILSGGFSYDAGFVITAQTSDVYKARGWKDNYAKLYKVGEYGLLTKEEMETQSSIQSKRGTIEIHNLSRSETSLASKLFKYAGKEDQYALTFSVKVAKDGPDGSTRAGGRHALTIVKITKDTVYVLNPWKNASNGRKCIEPIPIADFLKMTVSFVAHKIPEITVNNNSSSNPVEIPSGLRSILNNLNNNI